MTYYQPDHEYNAARVKARLTYFGLVTDTEFHPEALESLANDVFPRWSKDTEAHDWYEKVSEPLIKKWRSSLRWLPQKPKGKKDASNDPWLEFAAFAALRGWLRSGVNLDELNFKGTHSLYENPPLKDFYFEIRLFADYTKSLSMPTYNPAVEKSADFKKRMMVMLEKRLDELITDTDKNFDALGWKKEKTKREKKRERDQTKAVGAPMEHREWVTDNLEHYRWLYLRDICGESQAQIAQENSISNASVSEALSVLRELIY